MARRPRLKFPGAVYHVMSRGNRKSDIFADDIDRRYFLEALSDTARRYHVRVYAACLMDNHYHALLDTPRGNLSDAMRQLNGDYSQTFNRRHTKSGHTFEARFHSLVVQREGYLRRVARYVVANPVKAGLCEQATDWHWSTYRATAGLEPAPKWLYVEWLNWAFSAESRRDAQDRYCQYVNRTSQDPPIDLGAAVFGNKGFHKAALELWELERLDRRLPGAATVVPPPALNTIFAALASGAGECDEFIYIAHVTYGYQLAELASYLRLHPSTVAKAFQRTARRRR